MSDISSKLPIDLDREVVQFALTEWYEANHQDSPWRRTDGLCEILVSEMMNQQTQLGRMVEAWEAFLDEWPATADLMAADRTGVIGFRADHRLGYSNRTKYLHEAARQVEEGHGDEFPQTLNGLSELMDAGPYATNAVAFFAFSNGDAVVDTNVKRVLHRAFVVPDDDVAFETAASEPTPDGESRVWNDAIMELKGVACGKTPTYDESGYPWRRFCHTYEAGDFTAPDVPIQPSFEGSRWRFRGRIVRILSEYDELSLSKLGPRVRVGYGNDTGAEWFRGLVDDLESDDLIDVAEGGDGARVSLAKWPALR